MLVTSLCCWLYDGDWFVMFVTESLCWLLFSLCWWFSQCIKSVTNISNLSTTHLVSIIVTNIDITDGLCWWHFWNAGDRIKLLMVDFLSLQHNDTATKIAILSPLWNRLHHFVINITVAENLKVLAHMVCELCRLILIRIDFSVNILYWFFLNWPYSLYMAWETKFRWKWGRWGRWEGFMGIWGI